MRTTHRTFISTETQNIDTASSPLKTPIISRQKKSKNPKTVPQKRKVIGAIAKDIVDVASTSCCESFDAKVHVLKVILNSWKKGHDVNISVAPNEMNNLEDSISHLTVEDKNCTIKTVHMPNKNVVKGRPSGFLVTTPLTKKIPKKRR